MNARRLDSLEAAGPKDEMLVGPSKPLVWSGVATVPSSEMKWMVHMDTILPPDLYSRLLKLKMSP